MQAHAQSPATLASAAPTAAATATQASDPPISFDDLVDVVNPLQHLPIVSTLYRHYTHDEIKPLPKIAGDALYGGWMGLASSVADYAFERLTGKGFGDTVLAMVTGDDTSASKTAVASAAPSAKPAASAASASARPASAPALTAPPQTPPIKVATADRPPLPLSGASQPIPTLDAATLNAFMTAVNNKGLPGDLSQRTVEAYRRTMALQGQPPTGSSAVH